MLRKGVAGPLLEDDDAPELGRREERLFSVEAPVDHMPGEGGSHAWVEVLLPSETGEDLRPVAFDPTNRRRPMTRRGRSSVPPAA